MPSARSRASEPVEIDLDLELVLGVAQLHDGAVAVALLDISQRVLERLILVVGIAHALRRVFSLFATPSLLPRS